MSGGRPTKPEPHPRGEERHFFDAAARGGVGLTRCAACGRHFLPRAVCPHCWTLDVEPVTVPGRGVVHAFTVCHRAGAAGFEADVPYVVALVELEEGVRLLTNLVRIDPGEVAIGLPVHAVFERRGALTVPVFAPEESP